MKVASDWMVHLYIYLNARALVDHKLIEKKRKRSEKKEKKLHINPYMKVASD